MHTSPPSLTTHEYMVYRGEHPLDFSKPLAFFWTKHEARAWIKQNVPKQGRANVYISRVAVTEPRVAQTDREG